VYIIDYNKSLMVTLYSLMRLHKISPQSLHAAYVFTSLYAASLSLCFLSTLRCSYASSSRYDLSLSFSFVTILSLCLSGAPRVDSLRLLRSAGLRLRTLSLLLSDTCDYWIKTSHIIYTMNWIFAKSCF